MSRFYWILASSVGLIAAAWAVSAQPTRPGVPFPALPPPSVMAPGMMAPPPAGFPSLPLPMGLTPVEGGPWPPLPSHAQDRQGLAEVCLDRLAHRAAGRAYLKARLDLTPQQLPLWQELDDVAAEDDAEERQTCSKLPHNPWGQSITQRLDTAEERASNKLAHLRKVSGPLRKLTAALSPEQQKLIDQPVPPFPF